MVWIVTNNLLAPLMSQQNFFENYNDYNKNKYYFTFLEWFVRQGITNTLRKPRRNLQKEKKVWESK